MKKVILAATAAFTMLSPFGAQAAERTKLGVLECTIEGGVGLLVGSSKKGTCTFEHTDGSVESYTGKISKIGLDVGITGESFLKWVVFTPVGNEVGTHALAGSYVGVSTGVSLGIGLGANALIGGQAKNIGLQPLSVEGGTGLNIAVGVSSLKLSPA